MQNVFAEENDIPATEIELIKPQSPQEMTQCEQEQSFIQERKPRINAQFYSADAIQAISRLKVLSKQEPEYNKILFKLEDFPKNQEISLEIKHIGSANPKKYEHRFSFTIQDDDTMLINQTGQIIQSIICSSQGYLPGEQVFYRFRTADGSISKEISGTPTPATIRDKNHKIVLQADLVSIEPTVYQLFLPTMNEGEEYEFKISSLGETTKAKPKYTKAKPLHFSPAAKGNIKGGETILEIRRKNKQIYAIRLPWGTALESYHSGNKVYSPKP
jgi:hypothetical protein